MNNGAMTRLGVLILGVALVGCQVPPELQDALDAAFDDSVDGPGDIPDDPPAGPSCFSLRFVQPEPEAEKKVDILWVTDTSGSLDHEKATIVDGIDAFIDAMPVDVDYRMGVLLAHSSDSLYSGDLYSKNGAPRVLNSLTMSKNQIKSHLATNMVNQHWEWDTDGGEAGLTALNDALQPSAIAQIRSRGFFREDAALAVVFVSDENDICAVYPEGVDRVFDPDRLELPAFSNYCVNAGVGGNEVVTPELIVQKIASLQGDRPFVVSGIVYNGGESGDPSNVPSHGENEYGYGWLETISAANGISINLDNGDYVDGLGQIGSLVTLKLNLVTDFQLQHENIDESSIGVLVDGASASWSFSAALNQVHVPEPGGALSLVDIDYCLQEDDGGGNDGGGNQGGDDPNGGGDDGAGDGGIGV